MNWEAIGAIGELIGAIAPYQVVARGQCNDDKANTKQDHWLDLGSIQYDDFAGNRSDGDQQHELGMNAVIL